MKLCYILGALVSAVAAQGQVMTNEDAEAPAPVSVDLKATYTFGDAPLDPETGAVVVTNDEETAVTFTFTNLEPSPIVLAAFGGSIYDLKKPDTPYTNLSTSQVNPLQIAPGKDVVVTQPIKLALPPKEFEIGFIFYVQYEDQIFSKLLERTTISVVDPPVSNWDPKLIFVQGLIGLTATLIGYYASKKIVLPLIEKNLNKDKAGGDKKKTSTGSYKPKGDKKTGERSYDESWIPEHHLKTKKKE